jgi:hypothetical protein
MARKPDYDLTLLNKKTGRKNPSAGGAWLNDDGSINIQLNPFVTFTDDPDTIITLFPRSASHSPPFQPTPGPFDTGTRRMIVDDPFGGSNA